MKKTTHVISLVLISSLLTACHENPLLTHSKTKSVEFLIETSHQVEKKEHMSFQTGRSAWFSCMQEKELTRDCHALFDAMVIEAKHNKEFSQLNRSDLSDIAVFKKLEERYEDVLFNTVFED